MIDEVRGSQHSAIHNLRTGQNDNSTATKSGTKQDNTGVSGSAEGDVRLTDTAAKLRQIEAQIAEQPVVDVKRVESVKKAIADGSFQIDANRVAEKMADFENLLSSKTEKE